MSRALENIAAERRRQVEAEGWTLEHDDRHSHGELARAASCYAGVAGMQARGDALGSFTALHPNWPWERKWWKPKDQRHNLVKAAALILAEIERLDRLAQQEPQ